MTTFEDVVAGWQVADVDAIHPLRRVDVDGYWESGWFQAQQAAAFIPAGGTVVDYGCGDGRLSLPLAHMGFQVFAVDASPTMLQRLDVEVGKQTRDFAQEMVPFLCDGSDLAYKLGDNSVDGVVCRAVLIHHDYEGVEKLLTQFVRVLKPGGVLVADWPLGPRYVRQNWTDVTTWEPAHRAKLAKKLGLELVEDDTVSVWRNAN